LLKRSSSLWKGVNYSFLFFEYRAKPIVPNASPATEEPQEKKFKKKVDSRILITIKKGMTMPSIIRKMPRLRRKRGKFII
jgi:hypothetical protein